MLSLFRQPYGADGGVDARSAENAIGRSSLDLWDLVLRESLQNSWDARRDANGPISYAVDEYNMTVAQTDVLTKEIFSELPPHCQCTNLNRHVFDGRLRVMVISDSGTKGLGGPVRGHLAGSGERRDFVDFVRNLGRSTAKGLQGGTYGLGKGVLYKASKVGTCLIYSQTFHEGVIQPRIIGVSGGDGDYDDGGLRYTGRNWWGVPGDDAIVDPLVGESARELALSIGMPVPEANNTGTSIMILAPENEGYEAGLDRVQAMAGAALKWAWPHSIDTGHGPNILFSFTADGAELLVPDPLQSIEYREFASAYIEGRKRILDPEYSPDWQTTFTRIESKRPHKFLGLLVHRVSSSPESTSSELENTVALLRGPRMVVKYMPVSAQPKGIPTYGVFIAAHDLDQTFAKSEPVTHDDWVYQRASVSKNSANPVKIALDRIRDTFKSLAVEGVRGSGGVASKGASRVSASLGSLLSGFTGNGAEQQPERESRSGISRQRKARVKQVAEPGLVYTNRGITVRYSFSVIGGRNGDLVDLYVSAHVVTESGANEGSVPVSADTPAFLGWEADGRLDPNPTLRIEVPTERVFVAVFRQPQDTAMRASAQLNEVAYAGS
ncbi:hypothetical protein [Paenarthrobacter nicotinovorans]|uniref:hypothetical protein n=1 Tax=Paenarthrobacter nicotinovorans TaxID=29320 RepID=UPI003DA3F9B6